MNFTTYKIKLLIFCCFRSLVSGSSCDSFKNLFVICGLYFLKKDKSFLEMLTVSANLTWVFYLLLVVLCGKWKKPKVLTFFGINVIIEFLWFQNLSCVEVRQNVIELLSNVFQVTLNKVFPLFVLQVHQMQLKYHSS